MPFIKEFNKDFFIRDNKIVLSNEYKEKNQWKFKKITGSRFSSILGESAWTTEVKAWAVMVGIYKDKMDETLAYVGNVIEPKLKAYSEEKLNQRFLSYVPARINWDIFKNDMVFGGIPDGEPLDENGDLDYPNSRMLEIKTTAIDALVYEKIDNNLVMKKDRNNMPIVKEKNGGLKKWFRGDDLVVSNDYCLQLSLYLYLRGIDKGLFVIGFLKPEDYAFPEKYDPKNGLVKFMELDLVKTSFEEKIIYAKNWYLEHILTGESPRVTSKDRSWLNEEGIYY
ncbi:MAG: MPN551 family DNA-binding protein [Mycoplasmoidaceae bacterium]